MRPLSRRVRVVAWVLVAAAAALGVRVLARASTFQLFGNYVARVETAAPAIALTFDDGPHPRHTRRVLDVLERHGARGTFFMIGINVERHGGVAREVLQRGHEIGNHSYSHPPLIWMSPARVRQEIQRTDDLLRDAGVAGPIHFRPPHLAKLLVLPYVLREMGKLSVLADVDPEEWRRPSARTMTDQILRDVRPGSIVMMHDPNGDETIAALDNVLRTLRPQGYRFETVSDLLRLRRSRG